jgi:phospholipase/carboxylesterase
MPRIEAHRRKFGQMETICVDGSKEGPTVILMHGYGADMTDLASLAGVIQAPKGVNWVFPNGHLRIPTSPHTEGRGWFPISISELEKTMAAGTGIDLSQIVPPGLKKSREAIFHLIKELGVPLDRLILGGFSQGGMLATDVAVHLPTPPRGLAILSGTLVNADQWKMLAAKHAGFEFFQSHGKYDQVLSFAMAQKLEVALRDSGWVGKLMAFDGGHEIPSEVLIQLGAYLRRRLA